MECLADKPVYPLQQAMLKFMHRNKRKLSKRHLVCNITPGIILFDCFYYQAYYKQIVSGNFIYFNYFCTASFCMFYLFCKYCCPKPFKTFMFLNSWHFNYFNAKGFAAACFVAITFICSKLCAISFCCCSN